MSARTVDFEFSVVRQRRALLVLTILGFCMGLSQVAKADAISASMHSGVSAAITSDIQTSSDSAAWGVPTSHLSVSASATATDQGIFTFCKTSATCTDNAYVNGSAKWAPNGDSGTVKLNYGWSASNIYNGALDTHSCCAGPGNYSYDFTADATGNFVLDYNISAMGSPDGIQFYCFPFCYDFNPLFGLQGFAIYFSGQWTNLDIPFNFAGPAAFSSSGQLVFPVTAGDNYIFSIYNRGNIGGGINSYGDPLQASAQGDFSFVMPGAPTTPEPSSLMLFGTGLIGLAASLKRKFMR